MTATHMTPTTVRSSTRWLLLGSLALNLFFVGIAIAMAVRGPPPSSWDRNVFVRVERMAASLPAADADLMRGEVQANRAAIEETQTRYRSAQSAIRATLRQEPFNPDAMRAAMTEARTARLAFDQAVQSAFANAAAEMSVAGRSALADWPPGRRTDDKASVKAQ